ncbi:MAG: response regulator [Thermoanaerobaculales bacterium]
MSNATILVVDDDPDILETTKVALERSGYEVVTATNGFEALGAARIRKPDLILLDVMLPEENGYRVARALREDEEIGVYERPNRIILVTARDLSTEPDREQMFQDFAQPDRVIYKPFDLDNLLRQVEELLAEH